METTKLQAGYQYICDNNLVTNFQNYQFTELDINERKYRTLTNSMFYHHIQKKILREILTSNLN